MTKGFDKVFRLGAAKERVLEKARAWRKRHRRGIRFVNGDDDFAEAIDALEALEAEFEQEDYFLRWDVADQEREEP